MNACATRSAGGQAAYREVVRRSGCAATLQEEETNLPSPPPPIPRLCPTLTMEKALVPHVGSRKHESTPSKVTRYAIRPLNAMPVLAACSRMLPGVDERGQGGRGG